MDKKFITPVGMEVTKEQYEKDLKEPLEKLGYVLNCDVLRDESCKIYLCTYAPYNKYYNLLNFKGGNSDIYYIDHYNSELFLALAAMTKGNEPIIGEYVIASIGDINYLVKYSSKCNTGGLLNDHWICIDNDATKYNWQNGEGKFLTLKRKATKDELIKYITMKEEEFVLPKKWFIRVTNENKKVINDWKVKKYYNDNLFEHSYLYVKNNGAGEYDFSYVNTYTEITFEQFKKYVLKEDNIVEEEKESRFPFKLTPEDAQSIIEIACSTWKNKLAKKWATDIVLNKVTEISEDFYKEMRKACTPDQHISFDRIFGKDEKEFTSQDLKVGEYMEITEEGKFKGTIITKIYGGNIFVDIKNPNLTWGVNPAFKGRKVEVDISIKKYL